MVCDSAIGCGFDANGNAVGFGDDFAIGLSVSALAAIIETPEAGSTRTVNVNTLTTAQFFNMIGLSAASQPFEMTPSGESIIPLSAQDVAPSQDLIASVFGLESQDFSTLPFVDVTEPIDASVDQQALRAAVLSAGFLTAGVDNAIQQNQADFDVVFGDAVLSFVNPSDASNGAPGQLIVREPSGQGSPFVVSLEEIFDGAMQVADLQADQGSSAISQLNDFLDAQSDLIAAAPAGEPIDSTGSFPVVFTELEFVTNSIELSTVNTGFFAEVVNPDNLTFTAVLNEGVGSEFFDITVDTGNFVNFGLIGTVPPGTYMLEVEFDTDEGEPNVDVFEVVVEGAGVSIVEDSVTIARSVDNNVTVNISNNSDIQIASVEISGNGSDFVFVNQPSGSDSFGLFFDDLNPSATNGTFNFDVTIALNAFNDSGVQFIVNDTLELVVTD